MRRSGLLQAAIVFTIVGCYPNGFPDVGTRALPPSPSPTPQASWPAMSVPVQVSPTPSASPPPVATPTLSRVVTPTAHPAASPNAQAFPTASPLPTPSATPTPMPTTPANGLGLSLYDADLSRADDGELPDWQDVTGPAWLDHSAWTAKGGVWQMPDFSGNRYAFRRFTGDAFGGDGGMPDLYQVIVRIRPTGPDGTIAVCPYYLSPTQYCLVLLDRKAKTVSLWEMNGASPTGGTQGTYDLSQNHRGWQPLPAADADGAYTIKTKVNAQWHSLAVWIGSTWIDTPKVDSVTSQPHYVAIRSSGHPQEVVGISITRYTDPQQAR